MRVPRGLKLVLRVEYRPVHRSIAGAGNRLRGLAELSPGTAPGKVHERRSTECIGKQTAQEMPGATCHTKSYPLSRAPAQSVCLSDVCWKLSDRDQPHDHPQWLAQ